LELFFILVQLKSFVLSTPQRQFAKYNQIADGTQMITAKLSPALIIQAELSVNILVDVSGWMK
jgi:hypothetical protein